MGIFFYAILFFWRKEKKEKNIFKIFKVVFKFGERMNFYWSVLFSFHNMLCSIESSKRNGKFELFFSAHSSFMCIYWTSIKVLIKNSKRVVMIYRYFTFHAWLLVRRYAIFMTSHEGFKLLFTSNINIYHQFWSRLKTFHETILSIGN